MSYKVVRVTTENYHLFDNMIYWRMNNKERDDGENSVVLKENLHELGNKNLYIYAIKTENKFVGWVALVYIPKVGKYNGHGHIYVDELWVEPTYRGKGYAKELLKQAELLAQHKNASGIRLYVNAENEIAKNLYQQSGYNVSCLAYFMEK